MIDSLPTRTHPRWLFKILIVVSFGTVLWMLSSPDEVIFDEVHFGKFVTAYCCNHERIFDIHPPHGKLLIAGAAYMLGYRGGFPFEHIGQEYGSVSAAALRMLPAIAGGFVPLVIFGILRTLKVSQPFAFLGGLAVALDNALTVQSRLIGLDSLLLLVTLTSVWLFLLWLQSRKKQGIWLLVGTGALAGVAVGIKFTGLAALATVGAVLIFFLLRVLWQRRDSWQREALHFTTSGLVVLGVAVLVYLSGWVIHFSVLMKPGPGDAWGTPTGNIVHDIIQIHKSMLGANYNLTVSHPYGSKWWTWPAMTRPVFYWAGDQDNWIYFQGNPVVWWGSAILFCAALASFILEPSLRTKNPLVGILLVGYVIAYVPFMRVPRVLFLYHYLTPLIFSLLFGVWWLDTILQSKQRRRIVWWTSIILLVAGFIAFSPVTYGFNGWQQHLIWFPKWR